MLSNAEATCRSLCDTVRDYPGGLDSKRAVDLSDITLDLARVVKAQGRLDEAWQLCKEANDQDAQLVGTHLSLSNREDAKIRQRMCIRVHLYTCAGKMGIFADVPGAKRFQQGSLCR